MLQISGYGKLTDGTPHINGKPAIPCDCKERLLCGDGGPMLPWRCPECNAHLGKSGICLNACHLTGPQVRRFEDGLREAAATAREKHNAPIRERARSLYAEAQARHPQMFPQEWQYLNERDRGRWLSDACRELDAHIW